MEILVAIHGIGRWIVLLAALAAIVAGGAVWAGRASWQTGDRLGMIYTILLDIQVALGILIWILTILGLNSVQSILLVAHPLVMLLALGIAHMVRVRAGRAGSDPARGRLVTLGFLASLILIILGIPGFLLPAPA
jgi:hypothetical protein